MCLAWFTSMTRWLYWSLIRVWPLASRTARVGSGPVPRDRLQPAPVQVKYSHTGLSLASTSTIRLLLESVSNVLPLRSRLAKARPLAVP